MLPSISIGWGGVGAEFYLRMLHEDTALSRSLKILIASARVVIVQAMSGRSVSTRHCPTLCGNMYCADGKPVSVFLRSAPKADSEKQIRKQWVADHIALLDEIVSQRTENKEPGLVGSLYISSHSIQTKPDSVFPQIVTANELELLERHVHTLRGGFMVQAYLEKPSADALPLINTACARRCPNGISGTEKCRMEQLLSNCNCSSLHIDYYPTQALHNIAAGKLVKSITERLPRSALQKEARISLKPNYSQRFLVMQTKGNLTLQQRNPIMLFDSLCHHHPDIPIYLFILKGAVQVDDDVVAQFAQHGCRLIVLETDALSLVRNTPLQNWFASHREEFEGGPYFYSHLTDLFRLTALWKYGGFYLDTDFIIMQPIAHMRNSLVRETRQHINNAFSVFDAAHPFLEHTFRTVVHTYDPKGWGSLGPRLITRAFKSYGTNPCPGPKCVQLHEAHLAFPIDAQRTELLFNSATDDGSGRELENSSRTYALHYFNKLTEHYNLGNSSSLFKIYMKNCALCFDHF